MFCELCVEHWAKNLTPGVFVWGFYLHAATCNEYPVERTCGWNSYDALSDSASEPIACCPTLPWPMSASWRVRVCALPSLLSALHALHEHQQQHRFTAILLVVLLFTARSV